MCSPDQTSRNRFLPAKAEATPRHAGRKRKRTPLTLALYDPAVAEQRAAAASLLSLSARAGALVPFLAQPPVAAAPRAEPPSLRQHLDLRLDLTVHFIGEKVVTATDLDRQQNRFRLPTDDVLRSLRPILVAKELDAANIPRVGALVGPRARTKPKPPPPTEQELQQKKKTVKRTKKTGMKHGGLPVDLWNVDAGLMELQLTRWQSSRAIVIKGDGYQDYITRCGFKENDVVEIWAFKEREFHYFGACFLYGRPLCVVLAKKEQQPAPLLR